MIKRIEVIFRRSGVYSGGSVYDSRSTKYRDGQVIWAKNYPKGKHMSNIWEELRMQSMGFFVDQFHESVIFQTRPPDPPYVTGESPSGVLNRQSKYIQKRVFDFPEVYEFMPNKGKWAMSEAGYLANTVNFGGQIEIGVAEQVSENNYDHSLVDMYESKLSGQTKSFILFVYPDRYDAEIRAMYEIRITYW